MKPYTVEQLNENTWRISEVYHLPAALPMYLVVGSERAALIDTGMGIGDLLGTVREITEKPVAVYNTHAHMDHMGGNGQFSEIYMHPLEVANAHTAADKDDRIQFIELKCMYDPETEELLDYARKHICEYPTDYPVKTIEDGEIVDLGGVSLEAVCVPGHTAGCLVYVDRKNKTAFCGDACNPRSIIGYWPGGPTVRDYQAALARLLEKTEEVEQYFIGHRLYAFGREDIRDILICAKEIAEGAPGEPSAIVMSRKGPFRGQIHWYNGKRIVFNPENVR